MIRPKTITMTSKGQITVPVSLRRSLGIAKGTKVDIFPSLYRDRFTARIHGPSRILDYAGDLKHLNRQLDDNDEKVPMKRTKRHIKQR